MTLLYPDSDIPFHPNPGWFLGAFNCYDREETLGETLNRYDPLDPVQLQALYEAILNTTLDKPNFRRKIMKMNLLSPCTEKQQGVPHRAASLYRFDAEAYKHLSESGFAFEI